MGSWHSSWRAMRGALGPRDWMTWAELDGLLRNLGVCLSRYHLNLALAVAPPAKVKGGRRYKRRHLEMAVGYAATKGLGPGRKS